MRKILIIVIVSLIYGNEQIPAPPQKNPIVLQNEIIHTKVNAYFCARFYWASLLDRPCVLHEQNAL